MATNFSRFVWGTLRFDSIRTQSIRNTGSQHPWNNDTRTFLVLKTWQQTSVDSSEARYDSTRFDERSRSALPEVNIREIMIQEPSSFLQRGNKLQSIRRKLQPRSQGLSSLPPLVVGRKTLVAAGHVPSCDTNFSTGVGSTNNFCRSQLKRKKGPSFEIFLSCCKLHTGQMKYVHLHISSVSAGRRPVYLLLEVNCFAVSCSLN